MKKITIGVTDCSKYDKYAAWIRSHGPEIESIKLSEKTNNLNDAAQCHGIVFTGGEDVHPRYYNKPEYLSFCHQDDINEARDVFEMKLMDHTEQHGVPVLGICRGLQIYNVYRKGTLIPDIPAWDLKKVNHAKTTEGLDSYHPVNILPGSWLDQLTGLKHGETNSNHHQSADTIGDGLVLSASTVDGIVEAIDQKDPAGK